MKKLSILKLFALIFFPLVMGTQPSFAADPVVTWKVFSPFFPGTGENKTVQNWADDISKMGGGRIKINLTIPNRGEVFPDLHPPVKSGEIDAAYTWPGFVVGKYPAAALFAGTPAFFDLMGYFTWIHTYGGKELWQETYGNALKVFPAAICWSKVGAWTTKQIETMDDFKGLKYRIGDRVWGRTGDVIWEKILSDLGGSATKGPIALAARTFLLNGNLDAAQDNTPWRDMSFLGFHEVVKYCYFPGIQDTAGFLELIVNNQKWEALPPDLQEIIKGACDSAIARSLTKWAMDDAKVIKILNDQGKVGIRKFPREIQQKILDKFVTYYDNVNDPLFQKVWKSQKEFMNIYVPYMRLQQMDAEVRLK